VSVLKDVPDISFVTPQGAFYLFLNVSRYTNDSYKFSKQLLMKKGVATAPGISFGENGEGYVRISFSPPKDVLSKGIERLIEFLKEPGGSKYGN
jgi:aspartate/methionine/tyrosine aminotransferase